MDERDFGEDYFLRTGCGRPYVRDDVFVQFFGRIADFVVQQIQPRRVLDAGCAKGFLVEALRARGVEAFGFDLSSYAIAHVPESVRPFCWQASLTDEIAGTYDLVICQEVFAHLTVAQAETAIANFCRHTDAVLFSGTQYGPNPRHANLEPPEHWASLFARHEFYRDFDIDASVMTPAAVRYRRNPLRTDELVYLYEARLRAQK